jgi:hypothetical protein
MILRCRVMDYWFGWERYESGIVDGWNGLGRVEHVASMIPRKRFWHCLLAWEWDVKRTTLLRNYLLCTARLGWDELVMSLPGKKSRTLYTRFIVWVVWLLPSILIVDLTPVVVRICIEYNTR